MKPGHLISLSMAKPFPRSAGPSLVLRAGWAPLPGLSSVRPEPLTQRPGTKDPSSPEAAEAFTSAPFLGEERTELRCSLPTPTPRQTPLFPLPLPLGGATAPARGSLCGAGPARQDSRLLRSAQRRSPPPPRQGVRAPGNRGLAESKGGCRGVT